MMKQGERTQERKTDSTDILQFNVWPYNNPVIKTKAMYSLEWLQLRFR